MPTDNAAIGFAITDPDGGVAHYRAAVPANMVRAHGHTVVVSDALQITPAGTIALGIQMADGDPNAPMVAWQPDTVVLTGGWVSGMELENIDDARAEGQRVIVDIDDHLTVPRSNRHYDPRLPGAKVRAMARADLVTCSTPYLADALRRQTSTPVVVCRNRVERQHFAAAFEVNELHRRKQFPYYPERHMRLLACYRGGVAFHRDDLAQLPAAQIVRNGEWRFAHVGHDDGAPSLARALNVDESVVTRRPLVPWRAYPGLLAPADVGLLPLAARPFSMAKSAIGPLEFSAAGVPWIASAWNPEYVALDPESCVSKWRQWVAELDAMRDPSYRAGALHRQREAAARYGWATPSAAAEWAAALDVCTSSPKVGG